MTPSRGMQRMKKVKQDAALEACVRRHLVIVRVSDCLLPLAAVATLIAAAVAAAGTLLWVGEGKDYFMLKAGLQGAEELAPLLGALKVALGAALDLSSLCWHAYPAKSGGMRLHQDKFKEADESGGMRFKGLIKLGWGSQQSQKQTAALAKLPGNTYAAKAPGTHVSPAAKRKRDATYQAEAKGLGFKLNLTICGKRRGGFLKPLPEDEGGPKEAGGAGKYQRYSSSGEHAAIIAIE